MRSTKTIRAAKTGYIIISSLLMVLGVLIMALPDLSVSVIGILAGAMSFEICLVHPAPPPNGTAFFWHF